MQNATNSIKISLLSYLNETRFNTLEPNFIDGFSKINSIIGASKINSCNGIIIFLSASMQSSTLNDPILSFTSGLPPNYRLHTIAIGGCKINQYYAYKMSCSAKGF